MQADGRPTGLDRDDWFHAITKRAEHRYADTELSEAQKFTRTIEKDPLGQLLYAAYKAAPYPVPKEAPPPVDIHKAVADAKGAAHAQMHALAIDHQRATGKPYAQAYAHVYSDRATEKLRNKVKSEHLAATMTSWGGTMQGDTAYNTRNNPVGRATMSAVEG